MLVTHESIRNWCRKFGPEFAKRLRRRRRQPGDTWHLDEVFVRIRGMLHYIWRAVGSARGRAGRSSAGETRWCGRQTLSQAPAARPAIQTKRLVTDSLRSYGVAHRTLLPDIKHRTSPYRNNRAENSHRPSDGGSGRCSGSSHATRHRTSSRHTPSSAVISGHGVIASGPSAIGVFRPKHFGPDDGRPLFSSGIRLRMPMSLAPICSSIG